MTKRQTQIIQLMSDLGCSKQMAYVIFYLAKNGESTALDISGQWNVATSNIYTAITDLKEMEVLVDTGHHPKKYLLKEHWDIIFELVTGADHKLTKLKRLMEAELS